MKKENKELSDSISLWVMWIIVAAGMVVRIPGLGYSFYGDESFSLLRDSSQFLTNTEDRFRPVFFSLLYLWKQLGFSGEVGLRLLPMLFGIAQMPLAFLIGRELRDIWLGFTFTILVAASPLLIEFSQELRMYSLITTIAMLQGYLLLRLVRPPVSPPRAGGQRWMWIAFIATGLLGVYTHLFYWLFLIGCAVYLFYERKAVKIWQSAAGLGAIILLYLPNLPNLLEFSARRSEEYGFHAASAIPKLIAAFTVGFNYFSLPEQSAGRAVSWNDFSINGWIAVLVIIAAIPILWRVIWLHREHEKKKMLWFVYSLFFIPVVIAAIASFATGKYFLQPKYIIFCAPFLLLLIAEAYLSIRNDLARKLTAALGTAVFAIAMIHYWNPEDYGRRENWKAAAEILSTTDPESSVILLLPGRYELLYYYAPELRARTTIPNNPSVIPGDLTNKNIYYVRHDIAQNTEDPNDDLINGMNSSANFVGVAKFNPRLKLYEWVSK